MKVYVFLADGFELIEALTPVDFLRRAGLEVVTISISDSLSVLSSQNVSVNADKCVSDINSFSDAKCVILPGGMPGTLNLLNNEVVEKTVKEFYNDGKLVCAICAAPLILGAFGLLNGKKATSYPGFEGKLTGAEVVKRAVVCDKNVITASGVGAADRFSFEIIKYLLGKEKSDEIIKETTYDYE